MCEIGMEEASVWDETRRVVKRRATCSCCLAELKPGTTYLKHFSICDGHVTNQSICLDCTADRDEFIAAHDALIPPPRYFRELLESCIADGDEESEQKWKPMLERFRAREAAAERAA